MQMKNQPGRKNSFASGGGGMDKARLHTQAEQALSPVAFILSAPRAANVWAAPSSAVQSAENVSFGKDSH